MAPWGPGGEGVGVKVASEERHGAGGGLGVPRAEQAVRFAWLGSRVAAAGGVGLELGLWRGLAFVWEAPRRPRRD